LPRQHAGLFLYALLMGAVPGGIGRTLVQL
jgi:hypothetical protein